MGHRKADDGNTTIASLLVDPEDPDKGFVETKPPVFNLTIKGEFEGKERAQPRFNTGGEVFLRCGDNRTIRAKLRDVSVSGVGLYLDRKLKAYRIGEQFMIEFAQPHRLENLYLQIELTRVTREPNGMSQLGFRIVTEDKAPKKKIGSFINYLKSLDPFWG